MLKIVKNVIVTVLFLCCLFTFVGCDDGTIEIDFVKVTFRQEGYEDIVKSVKKGESLPLSSVPQVQPEEGYEIVWDRTEFTNLQKNVVVTAVKTPKQYTITYDLGEREGDSFASIEEREQTVTFGEKVTTYKPTCSGYIFVRWEIQDKNRTFTDGKYTYTEDITLIAVWQLSDNDDDRFSPIIPSN